MTLIVSFRTLDGIVLAGDSLMTWQDSPKVEGDVHVICPKCGNEHDVNAKLQGAAIPASTMPYAQKVFSIFGSFGIGTWGSSIVNNRTVYFAVKQFEKQFIDSHKDPLTSAEQVAELVGNHVHAEYRAGMEKWRSGYLDLQIDDFFALGLQVVGYDGDEPMTYAVNIGKTPKLVPFKGFDLTITGVKDVTDAFFGVYSKTPEVAPIPYMFSLQDAISYSEFLIKSTAAFQQFSPRIPSVGGDIDIAVVTPFNGFKWVQQKALYAKINKEQRYE